MDKLDNTISKNDYDSETGQWRGDDSRIAITFTVVLLDEVR